ncbi:insulinase family protein [Lachnospiraceae bacterium NSJ-143]|nr:insulinase family protein [Lachnospiraceae bacterium NSJ-143]
MKDFNTDKIYNGFRLIKKEFVDDINSMCHVFVHEKSGAKLFYAGNNDNNKVFFISFKTPPENSCGTAHIMEHSVLCGSEKYPVKDPFNELEKGSLNTYLNALTYADKTMYPVASCNDRDFENLVRVYVDAVFKPNVLIEEKIFMQEGWHYELEDINGDIKYNGVVYNEMKGALSQPERVLENCASKSLFGDTAYGFESGGDPNNIPELTYDAFKEFYHKFYYPSNSFIYLYGNMDIEQYLELLSDGYLSDYNDEKRECSIKEVMETFEDYAEAYYPVSKREADLRDSYFSLNFCAGKSTDILLQLGMEILCYILFESNASPVKKSAVESGLCGDLEGWFDSSTYQMTLNIVGKKCLYEDREKFKSLILDSLREVSERGIGYDLCISAVNYLEFLLREADYGYKPKGLAYGMRMMYGWLNGKDPIESIKIWKYFKELRTGAENGYFEGLIKEYILENRHCSFTVIKAKEGKQAEDEKAICDRLEKYREGLSEYEKKELVIKTKELRQYQESAERDEDLRKIPFVSINEVDKKAEKLDIEKADNGVNIFKDTNGIEYVKLIFGLENVPADMIYYAGLLARILGRIDTENYNYEKLPSEIDMYTGGIYAVIDVFENCGEIMPALTVNGKALERNTGKLFELLSEVVLKSDYGKTESLKKLIHELRLRNETAISENGHSYSALRALSYIRPASKYKEMVKGIEFNDFLLNAERDIDSTAEKLKETANIVFAKDNVKFCRLSGNGSGDIYNMFEKLKSGLNDTGKTGNKFEFIPSVMSEAIYNSSKIVYNSKGADFRQLGYKYTGAMNAVRNIVNTEYLWNQVRVKGGAYGSGCVMLRNGSIYAYSYRDPNSAKTFDIYNSTGDFLRGLDITESDISKFILGAVNEIDRPKSNADIFETAVLRYMNGITYDMIQKSRDELLGANRSDIMLCAEIFDEAMKHSALVTIGNENIIEENNKIYNKIRSLNG